MGLDIPEPQPVVICILKQTPTKLESSIILEFSGGQTHVGLAGYIATGCGSHYASLLSLVQLGEASRVI